MQQTPNYKLNKPEMGDTFSTAPLNENADKVDQTLARLDSSAEDLTQRVVALENCRMVAGWYLGNGDYSKGIHISLGERPVAVLVFYSAVHQTTSAMIVGDHTVTGQSGVCFRLEDDGFWVSQNLGGSYGGGYFYMAFLGDWPQKDFPTPPPIGT